jgi:hypothetical protein
VDIAKVHTGQLHPFEGGEGVPFSLEISLQRLEESLDVRYRLLVDIQELRLPLPDDSAFRKRELWQESCFELFLAGGDIQEYWEWNLAPDRCWNLFRFSDYRENMREEDILAPHLHTEKKEGCFTLNGLLKLPEELCDLTLLRVGVSCVLKDQSGRLRYWALSHPGAKPDFHDRRGFVLTL